MSLKLTYPILKEEARRFGVDIPDESGTVSRIRNYIAYGWIHPHPEKYLRKPLSRRQRLEVLVLMRALSLGLQSFQRRKLPLSATEEELEKALTMDVPEFIEWFEKIAPVIPGKEPRFPSLRRRKNPKGVSPSASLALK